MESVDNQETDTVVSTDVTDKTEEKVETKTETTPNPLLEKALNEKKNWKAKAQDLEEKLQNEADQRLKEKEDWKSLYESTKQKLDEVTTTLTVKEEETRNGYKTAALKRELEKLGAQGESVGTLLKLADLQGLKYDTEHKIVLGAEDAAKNIYDSIPQAFGKVTSKVDNRAPQSDFSGLDLDTYKNMSAKDRSDPEVQKRLFEKHGIALRK